MLYTKSIKLNYLENKVSDDIFKFITTDITNFVNAVCRQDDIEYKDFKSKLKFEAVGNEKSYFVFVPPFQGFASTFKFENFTDWGLEVTESPDIVLSPCPAEHGNHAFLIPFFHDNWEMLTMLEKGIRGYDDKEDSLLKQYLSELRDIRSSNTGYRNTRYHCAGVPFTHNYNELDWAARLFHSLVDHLPSDLKIYEDI